MTLFMILLDYKYRQTSRMAPPPGQYAGARSPKGAACSGPCRLHPDLLEPRIWIASATSPDRRHFAHLDWPFSDDPTPSKIAFFTIDRATTFLDFTNK